jgi:hypothetical protein
MYGFFTIEEQPLGVIGCKVTGGHLDIVPSAVFQQTLMLLPELFTKVENSPASKEFVELLRKLEFFPTWIQKRVERLVPKSPEEIEILQEIIVAGGDLVACYKRERLGKLVEERFPSRTSKDQVEVVKFLSTLRWFEVEAQVASVLTLDFIKRVLGFGKVSEGNNPQSLVSELKEVLAA